MVFDRFEIVAQPAAVIVAADGAATTLTGQADGETIAATLTDVVG